MIQAAISKRILPIVFRAQTRFHQTKTIEGVRKADGMRCIKGECLVVQKQLNYVPGLNVTLTKYQDWHSLFAVCNGTVFITREKVNLNFDHHLVRNSQDETVLYENVPLEKLAFNVVPDKQHQRFKLVEEI